MPRVIELEKNDFEPLINDVLQSLSILLIIEVMSYFFSNDKLLDKAFVRLTMYNIVGIMVYHLFINKLIGSGPTCCHLNNLYG
jgi:Ca2+-dependent lipid-binding protein